jgi:hypothetical protein
MLRVLKGLLDLYRKDLKKQGFKLSPVDAWSGWRSLDKAGHMLGRRLTDRACKVLLLASKEVHLLGHDSLGPLPSAFTGKPRARRREIARSGLSRPGRAPLPRPSSHRNMLNGQVFNRTAGRVYEPAHRSPATAWVPHPEGEGGSPCPALHGPQDATSRHGGPAPARAPPAPA